MPDEFRSIAFTLMNDDSIHPRIMSGMIHARIAGDTPAVSAMLDRLLHHGHVLKCGPKSWRMKAHTDLRNEENPS